MKTKSNIKPLFTGVDVVSLTAKSVIVSNGSILGLVGALRAAVLTKSYGSKV